MNPYLYQHRNKLLSVACMLVLLVTLNWRYSELQDLATIDPLEIAGEGGTALIVLMFLVFMLSCRPEGKVTRMIFIGASSLLLATTQNFLDALFTAQHPAWLFNAIETAPAILAICVLCFGLNRWAEEQRILNNQLQKQETFYREHASMDLVTGLYNANYLREIVSRELSNGRDFSLMAIDIDDFPAICEKFGHHETNRLLRHVGQVLQLGMRQSDLLCRYAVNRYIAVLTESELSIARHQAEDMQNSSRNIAYRHSQTRELIEVSLSIGISRSEAIDEVDAILSRAFKALDQAKQRGGRSVQVAA